MSVITEIWLQFDGDADRTNAEKHTYIDHIAIDTNKMFGTTRSADTTAPGERLYLWIMDFDDDNTSGTFGDPDIGSFLHFKLQGSDMLGLTRVTGMSHKL